MTTRDILQGYLDLSAELGGLLQEAEELAAKKLRGEAIETAVEIGTEISKKVAALLSAFVEVNVKLGGLVKDELIEEQTRTALLILNELESVAQATGESNALAQLIAQLTNLQVRAGLGDGPAMRLLLRDP